MSRLQTRYYRTGPMTPIKRDWILQQIDGLERSNRELTLRINNDTINVKVNCRQIEELKTILGRES